MAGRSPSRARPRAVRAARHPSGRRPGGRPALSPVAARPLVLFVGARADARARIAAALLDQLAGERYSAVATGEGGAAGNEATPDVLQALTDEEIDLTRAAGATLTRRLALSAHRVVFVGPPDEQAPPLPVPFERWGVPAPEGRHPDEVKVIVATLRRLVHRLIARLDTEALVT